MFITKEKVIQKFAFREVDKAFKEAVLPECPSENWSNCSDPS